MPACSSSSPATRTLISRTGRGGSSRRSSSSGDRPDVAQLVDRRRHRARPGDGREVVVADLDADRAAPLVLALERGAELLGQAAQLGLEQTQAAQVLVEGRLARLGLATRTVSMPRSSSKRASRPSNGPRRRPNHSLSGRPEVAASAPSVWMPWRSSRSAVFGPSPAGARGPRQQSARAPRPARSTTNPSGFSASEATLATSLLGPIPIEQPGRWPP